MATVGVGIQKKKLNGLLFIDQEFIKYYLVNSRVCEVCGLPLEEHDWVELGFQGFVERCSKVNNEPSWDA
jgi:hypothetical protein